MGRAIVIGGGIAGVVSALSLADNGYEVDIIEKGVSIGGHAMQLCCKATEQCNNCGVCLARDEIMKAASHPRIHILTNSEVVGLYGDSPDFQVEALTRPRYIDEEKCISCFSCYQHCPEPGEAIERPYLYSVPNMFSINKDRCLHFKKNSGRNSKCSICEEHCPTGAIAFDQQEKRTTLQAAAIIIATGFEVFDAREKGHLGYGRFSEVISGLDLEEILLMGGDGIISSSLLEGTPRVAFIQCVGSRDPHIGHDYCSRVCCKYAVRMAAKLRSQCDRIDLTIFYIDIQKTERDFCALLETMQENVKFIKGLPVEVERNENGVLSVRYENVDRGCLEHAQFDLIVLSVGIAPNQENQSIADILGVTIGEDGFFDSPYLMDSTISSRRGIFLAGACQGPKNIVETIAHGQEAALRALAFTRGTEVATR